jgi:hypothetical protein
MMMPTNTNANAVKPAIKKQRSGAAKKPRGLWAFGRQGAYGVWTFPSGAEFVEAFIAHANNATPAAKGHIAAKRGH